jgi:DDE superfamily endonuclease
LFFQISWNGNDNDDNIGIASWLLSVDGTHCRVQEPRSIPDKDWYSHKHHKPCVSYELGVHLFENRLVWINGPFKGGEPDVVIFRKPNGLRDRLPDNGMVIGDKGYSGENAVSAPNRLDERHVKQFKKRARARHECFNGRIKGFAVLSDRYRHSLESHKVVFEAVCIICQYSMQHGNPLFDI